MSKTDKSASDEFKPGTYFIGPDGKKHAKSQVTSAVNTIRKALGIDVRNRESDEKAKKVSER